MPGDILFLAHRVPWPPDRGDKIRSYHLLRYLGAHARVHLVAFTEGEDHAEVRRALAGCCASVSLVPRGKSRARALIEAMASRRPVSLAAFAAPAMRRAVAAVLARERIATAFVFSSQMAQYVDGFGGRLVMDFVDMDSAKFAAYAASARAPLSWLMLREARLLLAHDAAVARRAAASLFVSEAEAALFRERSGAERVHAIENGVDTDRFDPACAAADAPHPLIVFTGQMDYPPNVEAVRAFAHGVLPAIPGATFAIVGRAPTPAVRALAGARVMVTGEVADTRPWLAAADVVVAPLALARGVQNKVLEAMAMARPVVASPAAAEGIDHGGTLRVADAGAQAAAIGALLADAPAARALGEAARARVIARYGWDARLAPLAPLLGLAA